MNKPNVQVVDHNRGDGKINVSRLPMPNPETRVNGVWKLGRPEEWLGADFGNCVCEGKDRDMQWVTWQWLSAEEEGVSDA